MLTGAIVTTAIFALICSSLATIGNLTITRDFPEHALDFNRDILTDSPGFIRFVQYRLLTNLFYRQSLLLWALAGILLAYRLLSSI